MAEETTVYRMRDEDKEGKLKSDVGTSQVRSIPVCLATSRDLSYIPPRLDEPEGCSTYTLNPRDSATQVLVLKSQDSRPDVRPHVIALASIPQFPRLIGSVVAGQTVMDSGPVFSAGKQPVPSEQPV